MDITKVDQHSLLLRNDVLPVNAGGGSTEDGSKVGVKPEEGKLTPQGHQSLGSLLWPECSQRPQLVDRDGRLVVFALKKPEPWLPRHRVIDQVPELCDP